MPPSRLRPWWAKMANETLISGNGLAFPFAISPRSESKSGIEQVDGIERVNQSITHILSTPIGSRVMRRDFGSRLHELPFEVLDETTVALVQHFVIEAIVRWEKRIRLAGVQVTLDNKNQVMSIDIHYRIRSTNEQGGLSLQMGSGI